MGSRILSRSFGVEKWQSDADDDYDHEGNKSIGSSMDVDEQHPTGSEAQDDNDNAEDDDDEDDEDGHDSSDTAMVPMADMLNARYGTENVRLFIRFIRDISNVTTG
jgi:SET domain-containing protein 6